ncbi:M36 family metallopeptidase, partial [Verrucomicrobiota bacterium]
MIKKLFLIALVIVFVGVGFYFFIRNSEDAEVSSVKMSSKTALVSAPGDAADQDPVQSHGKSVDPASGQAHGSRITSASTTSNVLPVKAVTPARSLLKAGDIRFLSGPADGDPLNIALDFIKAKKKDLNLVASDLDDVLVSDNYKSRHNGVTHIYLRQRINGLEVANANMNINVARDGSVINLGNSFVPDLKSVVNTDEPGMTQMDAVAHAAEHLGLVISEDLVVRQSSDGAGQRQILSNGGISHDDIPVELVYYAKRDGAVVLTWNLRLDLKDDQQYWNMYIDAQSGDVVRKDNLVVSAQSYNVYALPKNSPHEGDRTLEVEPYLASPGSASPYGWHDTDGVAGADYTITRGNNVHAYEDSGDYNASIGNEPEGGAELIFDFPIDLTQDPSTYMAASVVNLFYLNNMAHDIFYEYGFDDVSGNFQVNNYGRGGTGNDAVRAEAQDGKEFNNANMLTLEEGSAPRMQMYLGNRYYPDVQKRDVSLDNQVVLHEYFHGVSHRLTGGPSFVLALREAQSRGLGEGWSDFAAYFLTAKPEYTGPDPRPVALWLNGEPADGLGIRSYPYSTDMDVNPHIYSDIGSAVIPHGIGSVWCAMLLEVYWKLVDAYGFDPDFYSGTGGNNLAMQLVMDGLKLQPIETTFLQARDAILLADQINNGGVNQAILWEAFAKRGLGVNADDGGLGDANVVVTDGFDVPDDLSVMPLGDSMAWGDEGGPFAPTSFVYTVTNTGSQAFNWTITNTAAWVDLSATGGLLSGGSSHSITVTVNSLSLSLPVGTHVDELTFENTSTGVEFYRELGLGVFDVPGIANEPLLPFPADDSDRVKPYVVLSWNNADGVPATNWPMNSIHNKVINGNFEYGSLSPWNLQTDTIGGWVINDGTFDPISGPGEPEDPFEGNYSARGWQMYIGYESIYQNLILPSNGGTITLEWYDKIQNYYRWFSAFTGFKVELRDQQDNLLEVLYETSEADNDSWIKPWTYRSADLTAYAGQPVRIVFSQRCRFGYFNTGLDEVRLHDDTTEFFDLYFGTNPLAMTRQATNLFSERYDPGELEFNTTYYWQIVASNSYGSATGAVWSFTTALDVMQLTEDAYQINEVDGEAVVSVVRMNDAADGVTVDYATSNGTAVAGSDYTMTTGTLVFAAGELTNSFSIPILDDNIGEPAEKFYIHLKDGSPGVALEDPDAAELTVVDDAILVALFMNTNYVDATPGTGEALNMKAALEAQGCLVSTFTGIDASSIGYALQGVNVLCVPELETGNLVSNLTLEVMTVISDFVSNGGGLIINGQSGDHDEDFLNQIFDYNLMSSIEGGLSLVTSNALGTGFEAGPGSIFENPTTYGLTNISLPMSGKSIYEVGSASTVTLFEYAAGKIVHLAYDWFDPASSGGQSGVWDEILRRALLAVFLPEDKLQVTPAEAFISSGYGGGSFSPDNKVYTLRNTGDSNITWLVTKNADWLDLSLSGGTLATGETVNISVTLNTNANMLALGQYRDVLVFDNMTSGRNQLRDVALNINQGWVPPPAPFNPDPTNLASLVSVEKDLSWNNVSFSFVDSFDTEEIFPHPASLPKIAWDGTNLIVADALNGSEVYIIDPSNGAIVSTGSHDVAFLMGICYAGNGEYWAGHLSDSFELVKLDSSFKTISTLEVALGDAPRGVFWEGGYLWTAGSSGIINKVDPVSGISLQSIDVVPGMRIDALFHDGEYLLALTADGKIYTVDPDSGGIVMSGDTPATNITSSMTWDGTFIWLVDRTPTGGSIYKFRQSVYSPPPTAYEVNFGTNPVSLPLIASNLVQTTVDPGVMDFDTTYYWEVTAANIEGTVTGPQWEFTTALDIFEFSSDAYGVEEADGNAVISVKRRNGTADGVSVDYTTIDGGTALAGADYTETTGTLVFTSGQLTNSFQIPVLNDGLSEPFETVHLLLQSPSAGTITGSQSEATLTITDDESLGVALFYDGAYVDTNLAAGEAASLKLALEDHGSTVNTFTGITAAVFTTALTGADILVVPELENGDLAAALDPAAVSVISNFVSAGKGLIIIGQEGTNDENFVNHIFGFAVQGETSTGQSILSLDSSATVFADGAASLLVNDGIYEWRALSLPLNGAVSIYDFNGHTTVAQIPVGSGSITFLGYDWFSAVPGGVQDGGWHEILRRSLLPAIGLEPFVEMKITGEGLEIADGDTLPTVDDGTGYGDHMVGGYHDHVFTISTRGSLNLNLTGTPAAVISGDTNHFIVTSQPETPVVPRSNMSFTVRFAPVSAGIKSATISIDNDDSDENPYDFTVQGRGLDAPIVTVGAATDIGGYDAVLNGVLTDGIEADVYVYWGTSDGGTNPAQWSNTGLLSLVSQGPFSYPVSGLDFNTTNYYAFYAENLAGSDWSTSSNFTTLSSSDILDILIIGSSHTFDSEQKDFSIDAIALELQNILSNDTNIVEDVHVVVEDIYRTKDLNTAVGPDPFWKNLQYRLYSLAQYYYWPEERMNRLDNLRGSNASDWDYVVIMDDPFLLCWMPGVYAEGVNAVVKEVVSGGAKPILLMQWPDTNSTFAVSHVSEISYRVGAGSESTVVPAGLAWEALSPKDFSLQHPTPDGAYLAASCIYSEMFNRSAAGSDYTYNDTIADHALTTVQAEKTNSHFSGEFAFNSPFRMKNVAKRHVLFNHTGSSTENGILSSLNDVFSISKVSYMKYGAPAFWPEALDRVDFNYGRGNSNFETEKKYDVYTNLYERSYGFPMQDHSYSAPVTMLYGIDKRYYVGGGYNDGTDLGIAFDMIQYNQVDLDTRDIPIRLMWAKMHDVDPAILPNGDDWHMSGFLNQAAAAYIYTLLSGRCPVDDEPETPFTSTWHNWLGRKIGYETAYRMHSLYGRVSGFQVQPSSVSLIDLPFGTDTEDLTVKFVYAPTSDVVVAVSIDNTNAAYVVTSTNLLFTPSNYSNQQVVTVEIVPGLYGSESFDVIFTTSSDDLVYDGLVDQWNYTVTRSPDMGVLGNGVEIQDEDVIPSGLDHTEFGDVDHAGGSISRVFTITNNGSRVLNLTGSPVVQLTGDTNVFTVTSQPLTNAVEVGAGTTFTVKFDPDTQGFINASVSIDSDAPFENPYNFAIRGVGSAVPSVECGDATDIHGVTATLNGTLTDGFQADIRVYWGTSYGDIDPAQWGNTGLISYVSEGAFSYNLTGLQPDTRYYYIFRAETDVGYAWSSWNSFTTLPAIYDFRVQRGSSMINNGSSFVRLFNGVDYTLDPGSTISNAFIRIVNTSLTGGGDPYYVDPSSKQHMVRIGNPENLLTSINLSRSSSDNYSEVTWEIVEYIGEAGGPNEIIVRDQDFLVNGQLVVTGAVVNSISDINRVVVYVTGATLNDLRNNDHKGLYTAEIDSSKRPVFTCNNAKVGRVSYAVVEFAGTNWSNVQRVEHLVSALGVDEMESITAVDTNRAFMHIQCRAGGRNKIGAQVSFAASDTVAFRKDFGGVGDTTMAAWIVENSSADPFAEMKVQHIKEVHPTGISPQYWTNAIAPVVEMENASIIGESASSEGDCVKLNLILTDIDEVSFFRSKGDVESHYAYSVLEWPLRRVDTPPAVEMEVYGKGAEIPSSDSIPSLTDDTDFGDVQVGLGRTHVFTITNSGLLTLNLTGNPVVQLSGDADFTVTSQPGISTIPPGASTTFTVELAPAMLGVKSATVSIANDDSDENPYTFVVQGECVPPATEMAVLGDGLEIINGDNTPSVLDGTEYGEEGVGQPADQVFVITNMGLVNLILSGSPAVEISGDADFTVFSQPSTNIAVGSSASFTVRFMPAATGTVSAVVSIANNDTDENPYTFDVQGTGSELPVVVSSSATDIGGYTATLNGTLDDGTTADIYVYWGTAPGGTDPAQWGNTGLLTSVSEG